jgi:hypothetical protein
MSKILVVYLALVLSLVILGSQSNIYAIGTSERTSAIESRLRFLDEHCIGICPKGPIETGPIETEDIENGAVTNPKIADNAVTNEKIAEGVITGSKIQGLDKLIFVECGIFDHPITLEPSRSMGAVCDAPGIEVGDKIVATLNPIQPTAYGCFEVTDSQVGETGIGLRPFATITNGCDHKATESFTLGMIIYKTVTNPTP